VAEPDMRKSLVHILRLLLNVQQRVIELDLHIRALRVVLAEATGVDLKSVEDHLQKIAESLRSAEVDTANEEVSAMLDFLEMGKEPDGSDA
jgi:cobalamin biosynthesis protein CobD/CbiB